MTANPRTFGYVLSAPRRPKLEMQLEIMRSHDLDLGQYGPVYVDKVKSIKRGPTPKDGKLSERDEMVKRLEPGDKVIVAAPECLGVSRDDAEKFVGALLAKNVTLQVSGRVWSVRTGEDAVSLLDTLKKWQHAAYVRKYRSKQPST